MRASSLSVLFMLVAASCALPEAKDAEIGCAVDSAISPRCPNYPRPAGNGGPAGAPGPLDAGASLDAANGPGLDAGLEDSAAGGTDTDAGDGA